MQDGTNIFLSNCCPIGVGSLDEKVLGSVHASLNATNINGGRGGAVAEWSKALQFRKKINENKKIPGSPPDVDNL